MGEGRLDRVHFWLCLAAKFRSEKIPRNRLGMVSVIPQKKVLRGIPRFTEESIPKLGTKQNDTKKNCLKNSPPAIRIYSVCSSETCFGIKFWEFATIFVPRNGMLSWFLFRCMVWNRIPSVCFYFSSVDQNSELFSLPRNGFRTEFRELNQLFRLFRLPQNNFFVGNCQPYCWGIREVDRGEKYFLSYEGRDMKGEIWVEWEGRENRLFCQCLRFSKYGKQNHNFNKMGSTVMNYGPLRQCIKKKSGPPQRLRFLLNIVCLNWNINEPKKVAWSQQTFKKKSVKI